MADSDGLLIAVRLGLCPNLVVALLAVLVTVGNSYHFLKTNGDVNWALRTLPVRCSSH